MLTGTSSAASRIKMLVLAPLALVCIVCFSKNSVAQQFERKGNKVTYRGNIFEYNGDKEVDTQIITDPVTGTEMTRLITKDPVPVKMNGATIYGTYMTAKAELPEAYAKNGSVEDYLIRNLSAEFDKLPDGTYRVGLNNIVADTKGRIAFYEFTGMKNGNKKTPPDVEKLIELKIDQLLHKMPALKPGTVNNKPVIAVANVSFWPYRIEVKDHHATVRKQ